MPVVKFLYLPFTFAGMKETIQKRNPGNIFNEYDKTFLCDRHIHMNEKFILERNSMKVFSMEEALYITVANSIK